MQQGLHVSQMQQGLHVSQMQQGLHVSQIPPVPKSHMFMVIFFCLSASMLLFTIRTRSWFTVAFSVSGSCLGCQGYFQPDHCLFPCALLVQHSG
jgi:hypothetical protein